MLNRIVLATFLVVSLSTFSGTTPAHSAGCKAVVVTGLFGEFLAPMNDIKADLRRKGCTVVGVSSFGMIPRDTTGATVVVGHSMGCFSVNASKAHNKIYIDCPFWSGGWQARKGDRAWNYYTPGHPRTSGATNIPIATNHLNAPRVARPYIQKSL